MKPTANVDTTNEMVADMRLIDHDKIRFFDKAMEKYFFDYIWSLKDNRNDFAIRMSDAAYKYMDIVAGMVLKVIRKIKLRYLGYANVFISQKH